MIMVKDITNRVFLIVGVLFTLMITACGPSDEEMLKAAENKVQSFIAELAIQNFNSAYKIYPGLRKIDRFNVIDNFTITSSSLDDDYLIVNGKYGPKKFSKNIQFKLKYSDGVYTIEKSKGLSSYYETPLFELLKRTNCFTDIESDEVIHSECKSNSVKFEDLVNTTKGDIEKSIQFNKLGSNLKSDGFGIGISGELTLENKSNISIPGFAYNIYILLFNSNGQLIHTKEYEFNYDPIIYNQLHQIKVYSMDYNSSYSSYTAVVRIINDQFIREYLARYGSLDCK